MSAVSPYVVREVAQAFHEEYERQARANGWATQAVSRVPWSEVPDANRVTMLATVRALFNAGVIAYVGADRASGESGSETEC